MVWICIVVFLLIFSIGLGVLYAKDAGVSEGFGMAFACILVTATIAALSGVVLTVIANSSAKLQLDKTEEYPLVETGYVSADSYGLTMVVRDNGRVTEKSFSSNMANLVKDDGPTRVQVETFIQSNSTLVPWTTDTHQSITIFSKDVVEITSKG